MTTYLALGDSYTIGEGLPMNENLPHQLAALLRAAYPDLSDPVIIATTGWTTGELWEAVQQHHLTETFSFVTLLIGVNNQYRGMSLENYEVEFERLLLQAVSFANGGNKQVLVLSIPDWGLTPFAEGRDRAEIAREIDAFNDMNRRLTEARNVPYLDITGISRDFGKDPAHLVSDGLHYSAAHYALWAEKAAEIMRSQTAATKENDASLNPEP